MHPRMKIKELAMESNVMLYRVAFRISDVPWKIRWKITRFYIAFKRRWKEAGTIRSGSFSFTHFLFLRETIGIDMYCDFFDKCTYIFYISSRYFILFYFHLYIFSFFPVHRACFFKIIPRERKFFTQPDIFLRLIYYFPISL